MKVDRNSILEFSNQYSVRTRIDNISKFQRRSIMENVNSTAKVNQKQEYPARKPWQTPAVEELLVSESENPANPIGSGDGIYVGS